MSDPKRRSICMVITGPPPSIADIRAAPGTPAEAITSMQVTGGRSGPQAARMRRAAGICAQYGRPVATWRQGRAILGLRAA